MTTSPPSTSAGRHRTIAALTELVAALDRRVPQVEHTGELQIASDAARLRGEASLRIEQLRRSAASQQDSDANRSGEVMTDDGGPAPQE